MARVRSPNYPVLSLPEAIERIGRVHARERQHPASREVIMKGMGYGGVHGASLGALSAAVKYGLLEQKGKGEDYRVSDRAVAILHPHDAAEKAQAIKAAARSPRLFGELLDHFKGDLPSDDNLRAYLVRRSFSQIALTVVIQSFRDTIDLVTRESPDYTGFKANEVEPPMELAEAELPGSGALRRKVAAVETVGQSPPKLTVLGDAIEIVGRINDRATMDELRRRLDILREILPKPTTPEPNSEPEADNEGDDT